MSVVSSQFFINFFIVNSSIEECERGRRACLREKAMDRARAPPMPSTHLKAKIEIIEAYARTQIQNTKNIAKL